MDEKELKQHITEEKFKKYVDSLMISKSLDGLTAEEVAEAKDIIGKAYTLFLHSNECERCLNKGKCQGSEAGK